MHELENRSRTDGLIILRHPASSIQHPASSIEYRVSSIKREALFRFASIFCQKNPILLREIGGHRLDDPLPGFDRRQLGV